MKRRDFLKHTAAGSAALALSPTLPVAAFKQRSPRPSRQLFDRGWRFVLYPNYPNPFNPATILSYEMPRAAHVTLKIVDILSREVKTLVDALQPAGLHRVTFEADDLPSGVYFYRMEAGSFTATEKMTLIR